MKSKVKVKALSLNQIKNEIKKTKAKLKRVHAARQEVRGYLVQPLTKRGASGAATFRAIGTKKTFVLLAQGDSWFDYPPGNDIVDCLHSNHGHEITNLAVAGSTLNDEVYGPVPNEMFGLGPKQSDDPSRIVELVNQIQDLRPQGLLISAGGNDVAGDEFFSFINNKKSGLPAVNAAVLDGVVNGTFKTAYTYFIDTALAAAADVNIKMPIFTHGYDYPWPDGRGVFSFIGWKVGPWFDSTFNHKNYPNDTKTDLQERHDIVKIFIDSLNAMLKGLAQQYAGKVFHVDLTGTLNGQGDWANELHPVNKGFRALAAKIDDALQKNI